MLGSTAVGSYELTVAFVFVNVVAVELALSVGSVLLRDVTLALHHVMPRNPDIIEVEPDGIFHEDLIEYNEQSRNVITA